MWIEGLAKGGIDRLGSVEVEEELGYKSRSQWWAMEFQRAIGSLVATMRASAMSPTAKFPRKFRAAPGRKRPIAVRIQKRLRAWRAKFGNRVETVKRLTSPAAGPVDAGEVTSAHAPLEDYICGRNGSRKIRDDRNQRCHAYS